MSIELDPTRIGDPVYERDGSGATTLTFFNEGAEYVTRILRADREQREQREREDAIEDLVRKHSEALAHKGVSAASLLIQLSKLAEDVQRVVNR